MKVLADNMEALNNFCSYCGADPKDRCRVMRGNFYTVGKEPRDNWGRPLIHDKRLATNKEKEDEPEDKG